MNRSVVFKKKLLREITLVLNKIMNVGFLHLLSSNILLQFAGFGGQVFLTRFLSAEDIGRIRVLQSFLGIILIIATLGINTAILRYCSENIEQEKKQKLFNVGIKINLIISIVVVTMVYILSEFKVFSEESTINTAMQVYIFQLPFLVISGVVINYLQAQKKIKTISKIQSLSKILVILVSSIFACIFGFMGYVVGIMVSNACTFALIVPLIKDELKKFRSSQITKSEVRQLLNIGRFAFLANLLSQFVLSLNIIMANYLIGDKEQIGYYSIAQLIITTLMMIPFTLNQIMVPYLSEQSNNIDKLIGILKVYQKRMRIITTVVAFLAYFTIPILIPIVFGKQYNESIVDFKILLLGLIFWSLYSPKGVTLLSIGRIDLNFYTSLWSFGTNIILNFIMIKQYGMTGAAIANSVTYFITYFINNFYYKKYIINATKKVIIAE